MSIRKRGDVYHVDIANPKGASFPRIRHTIGTSDRKAAQEYHDRLKNDLWRVAKLGEKQRQSWDAACVKWLTESTKRSLDCDALRIKKLTQMRGMMLDEITRSYWDTVLSELRASAIVKKEQQNARRAAKQQPPLPIDTLAINANLNRYTALVSAILNKATREWEWIEQAPTLRKFEEKEGRNRWITHAQAATLLAELPEHLREITIFSLATGLRLANVFLLEWAWVDIPNRTVRIPSASFKTGDDHGVPLPSIAMTVLERQEGRHAERVFTYRGKPIRRYGLAWKKALVRAEIKDFRWHDLRHTWASWLRQSGQSLDVIEALGGWKDGKMPRRYSHISTQHLAPHVADLDRIIRSAAGECGTNSSQPAFETAAP